MATMNCINRVLFPQLDDVTDEGVLFFDVHFDEIIENELYE